MQFYGEGSNRETRGWQVHMAYYRITADESGKLNSKADYTSFCGYIALWSEWIRFEMEWESCLFKWGVPPIHMAKIYRPESDEQWAKVKDKWATNWESERDRMLLEFASIVNTSQLVGIGGVVDSAHFRSLPNST